MSLFLLWCPPCMTGDGPKMVHFGPKMATHGRLATFFGRFLLRLSLIKSSQVMFMVKYSLTPLNFGYDFVLLVHFFGTPCLCVIQK